MFASTNLLDLGALGQAVHQLGPLEVLDVVHAGLLLFLLGLDGFVWLLLFFLLLLVGILSLFGGLLLLFKLFLQLFFAVVAVEITEAHLTLVVEAPHVDFSVFSEGDRVLFTTCDVANWHCLQLLDYCRNMSIHLVANPELSPSVLAPGVEMTLRVHEERVILPGKNVDSVFGSDRRNPHSPLKLVASVEDAANLARVIATPRIDLLICR